MQKLTRRVGRAVTAAEEPIREQTNIISTWRNFGTTLVDRVSSPEGIEGPPILPAVGATLVVARSAYRVRRQQGDHKAGSPKNSAFWGAPGRPYIIQVAFQDALILQFG